MQAIKLLAAASAAALILGAPAEARDHRHYHGHRDGNGAAVGAALGAGIFLGALAGTAAAEAREPVYAEPPPPPPPRYGAYYSDRAEGANEAIDACRRGLLDAARQYGAFDAEIGDIYSVRETEFGHRVQAEVTIDYPDYSRISVVTCRTENGLLVSARSEN